MRRTKIWAAIAAVLLVMTVTVAGCGLLENNEDRDRQNASGNDTASGDPVAPGDQGAQDEQSIGEDEQTMPVWVPFEIDSYPETALEGFLYEGAPVQAASIREAAESGDNVSRITEQIRQKIPHYPFAQVPLIEPDMLVDTSEQAIGDDISVTVTYYTKSGFDDALEFYRSSLQDFDRYDESKYDSETGASYDLSFAAEVDGGFKMDASVMVMRMPESTGYECCIYFHGAIRGAAKKETEPVGIREDGLPENFPDNIVQAYKVKEIYMAEAYSDSCYIQFDSRATYTGAVEFYRNELNDLTDFRESNETEGEVWFYCKAPGWSIDVRVMDNEGRAYVEIGCYME